jgi:hypothetical protein
MRLSLMLAAAMALSGVRVHASGNSAAAEEEAARAAAEQKAEAEELAKTMRERLGQNEEAELSEAKAAEVNQAIIDSETEEQNLRPAPGSNTAAVMDPQRMAGIVAKADAAQKARIAEWSGDSPADRMNRSAVAARVEVENRFKGDDAALKAFRAERSAKDRATGSVAGRSAAQNDFTIQFKIPGLGVNLREDNSTHQPVPSKEAMKAQLDYDYGSPSYRLGVEGAATLESHLLDPASLQDRQRFNELRNGDTGAHYTAAMGTLYARLDAARVLRPDLGIPGNFGRIPPAGREDLWNRIFALDSKAHNGALAQDAMSPEQRDRNHDLDIANQSDEAYRIWRDMGGSPSSSSSTSKQ